MGFGGGGVKLLDYLITGLGVKLWGKCDYVIVESSLSGNEPQFVMHILI